MNKPLFALGVSLLLLGIGMLYGVSAAAQSFDACIAQYAAGVSGWCKVSDDVFNNVRFPDSEATRLNIRGSNGSTGVMIAWSGAAFDPDRLIMYFNGGGHNVYYGNEWYSYDIRAGKFERLNDPSPITHYYANPEGDGYCLVPDPALAPKATHTYDGRQFYPATGTIYVIDHGASKQCGAAPAGGILLSTPSRNVYEFNPSKTEIRNGIPPLTYRNHGRYNFFYPRSAIINGRLIMGSNLQLYSFNVSGDQLTDSYLYFSNIATGEGTVDSINGTMVAYLNGGNLWTKDQSGTKLQINGRIPNGNGMACGVTECVFWEGGKSVTVWKPSNPGTYQVVNHTEGPVNGDYRVYSKIQYIPDYNVYVGVSNVNQPVYLYKVAGAVTPDPEPDPEPAPVPSQTYQRLIETDTVCSNPNWRVFVDGVQLTQTFQRETTMSDAMNNAKLASPDAEVTSTLNVTCRVIHTTEDFTIDTPVAGDGFENEPDLSTLAERPVLFSQETMWTVSDGQYLYTVESDENGPVYPLTPISKSKIVSVSDLGEFISNIQ